MCTSRYIRDTEYAAAPAFAGEGSLPKEEVLRAAEKLTDFQRAISLDAATERSFTGKTVNGYACEGEGNLGRCSLRQGAVRI